MVKVKVQITERPCKDCKVIIEYVPRRVICINCYIKKNKLNNDATLFIKEDD
jgi:Zn finger protein HypA/HybF involved in hydrogenase expression